MLPAVIHVEPEERVHLLVGPVPHQRNAAAAFLPDRMAHLEIGVEQGIAYVGGPGARNLPTVAYVADSLDAPAHLHFR